MSTNSNGSGAASTSAEDDLCFTSAIDLSRLIRARDLSPVELMKAVVKRSERLQPRVNCFVTLQAEQALEQAYAAEKTLMSTPASELPPLFGIPVTVKDTDDTAGVRTTYGSLHFADYVPDEDATIWARMKAAGAILLGKTTTPEFALSSVTESKLTGITNNPWNLAYSVAGSSGGAAAAAAAGLGPLATGSDGGGSIRAPSSFCGVVGLKGSPGRVPYNRRDNAWDNACVNGPITRTVADNAFMLDVIAGPDPYDAISLPPSEISFLKQLEKPSMRGLRIAYCADLGNGPVDPEVTSVVSHAVARFASDLGAIVEPVTIELPDPAEYFISFWGPAIVVMYEDMMLPLGNPEWLPDNIPDMVQRARAVDIGRYSRTIERTRSQIHAAFADIFAKYDYLIWPTTPVAPFPHPGPLRGPQEVNGVRIEHPGLQNQRYTEAISHAGYPAITVPAGFSKAGLPIGMQIAAGHFKDAEVLRAAAAFEAAAPWAHLRPIC